MEAEKLTNSAAILCALPKENSLTGKLIGSLCIAQVVQYQGTPGVVPDRVLLLS